MLTGIKGKYRNLWRMMLLAQMGIMRVAYADGTNGGAVAVPAPSMPDIKAGAKVLPDANLLSAPKQVMAEIRQAGIDRQASAQAHRQVMAAIPAAAQKMMDRIAMPVRLPTHPNIRAGDVDIRTYGHVTDVVLKNNAAIDWQSFSVGKGNTFRVRNDIDQKNTTILLSTVTGQDRSVIEGGLQTKNSHLWLSNPNGIDIKDGAAIDSHFLATTKLLDITDFVAGNYNFKGDSHAYITLSGKVTMATPGRWVAMAAEHIHGQNDLLLAAPAHRLILGGVEAFSLDLEGDNLYGFKVDATKASHSLSVQLDAQSKLEADRGYVLVTTQEAIDTAASVVNVDGFIEAKKLDTDPNTGVIHLKGGKGSKVTVGGTLSATGHGTTGGKVYVEGSDIQVNRTLDASGDVEGSDIQVNRTLLDASGDLGGGRIAVGGQDLRVFRQDGTRGDGTFMMADNTTISKGATLKADAIQNGHGGKIELWGTKKLTVKGYAKGDGPSVASARGGALSGNGGFVELSIGSGGKWDINDKGFIDRTAPHGNEGMLFYDPPNIYIDANYGNGSWISSANLITDLQGGDVTLSTVSNVPETVGGNAGGSLTTIDSTGSGGIYLEGKLNLNANGLGNIGTLTLEAAGNITLNDTMTVGNSNVYLRAGMSGTGSITSPGNVTFGGQGVVYAYYADAGNLANAPGLSFTDASANANNNVIFRWIGSDGTSGDWNTVAGNWNATSAYNYAVLNSFSLGNNDRDISNAQVLTGHWDGRNNTISLPFPVRTSFPSLFPSINNASSTIPAVQNLVISYWNYYDDSNTSPTGALAGVLLGGLLQGNAALIGSMKTGGSQVGGLIGSVMGGVLNQNSIVIRSNITGTDYVGGLVGQVNGAVLNNNSVDGQGNGVHLVSTTVGSNVGDIVGGGGFGGGTGNASNGITTSAPTQSPGNFSPSEISSIQNVGTSLSGVSSIVAPAPSGDFTVSTPATPASGGDAGVGDSGGGSSGDGNEEGGDAGVGDSGGGSSGDENEEESEVLPEN